MGSSVLLVTVAAGKIKSAATSAVFGGSGYAGKRRKFKQRNAEIVQTLHLASTDGHLIEDKAADKG